MYAVPRLAFEAFALATLPWVVASLVATSLDAVGWRPFEICIRIAGYVLASVWVGSRAHSRYWAKWPNRLSVEEFERKQRTWLLAGLIALMVWIPLAGWNVARFVPRSIPAGEYQYAFVYEPVVRNGALEVLVERGRWYDAPIWAHTDSATVLTIDGASATPSEVAAYMNQDDVPYDAKIVLGPDMYVKRLLLETIDDY